jgi:hypothetical protein
VIKANQLSNELALAQPIAFHNRLLGFLPDRNLAMERPSYSSCNAIFHEYKRTDLGGIETVRQ